jgi:hypothetical protein
MNNIGRKTLNILFVIAVLVCAVSIAITCERAYLAVIFPLWVLSGYFKGSADADVRTWDKTKKLLDGQMEYVKDLEKELVEKTREIEELKKNDR